MLKKDEIREEIKQEKAEEKSPKKDSYTDLHRKSWQELAKEIRIKKKEPEETSVIKEKPDEEPKESKKEEKKEEKTVEPKVNVDEITRKAREEAEKVTREQLETQKKEFQSKIDEILNKDKDILEKQKEADELVAVWEKEKRLPTDWKEIASEQLRISNAKLEQRLKQIEETNKQKVKEQEEREKTEKDNQQRNYQTRIDEINKKVERELQELYEGKYLKKPVDISKFDAEDMGETNDLIKFGIELNKKRVEQKLEPVDSIAKIYFMHYKPVKDAEGKKNNQPAGADAPVSGAKVVPVAQKQQGYNYAKDHNKSYRQLIVETLRAKTS